MKKLKIFINICLLVFLAIACKDKSVEPDTSVKEITGFSFQGLGNAAIDRFKHTIFINVPDGTDLSKLIPSISLSANASVSPVSGVAQDFSKPVSYTVTSKDGSTQQYKVFVQLENSDIVFIGSSNGKLYAVYALTGQKKWEAGTAGYILGSPTLNDGLVYIGSNDRKLYAFSASTGEKKWDFSIDPDPGTDAGINSTPMVTDGIIYFGGTNKLYALDALTGEKKWSFSAAGFVRSSPTVSNGLVYFGDGFGKCYALNAKNGTKIWEFTSGAAIVSNPCISGGLVYVTSTDQKIYALDARTGLKTWEFATKGFIESSPGFLNNTLFAGSTDGSLYALDALSGSKKWEFKPLAISTGSLHHHWFRGICSM
ncbi:PQQ-binding-like beta-propeller repeat protein [Pseudarcicella hirudinis]|uniref:outer membrane protein assembly factor BamB family protein n=1 Tax=Pseudarcicella hirudinis TaxID=1079859 RepID=UPI0035E73840